MNNVEKSTIVRSIILALSLLNQIVVSMGYNSLPFDDQNMTETVSSLVTIVVSIWTWWKNNSFTEEAIKADQYLRECKKCKEDKV